MNEKKIDLRITKTEQLLENSLINLLEIKSFEQITIKDITEYAQINRSTFYLHYENKDHLFNSIIDKILNKLLFDLIELEEDSFSKIQKKTALHIFSTIKDHKQFFKVMLLKGPSIKFSNYMVKLISEFYEKKIISHNVNMDYSPVSKNLIVNYLASAYVGVIQWWLKNDLEKSVDEISNEMINLNNLGPMGVLRLSKERTNTLMKF
ncbi:MAG: TetR/AcrR family transcriptional regulator [Sarcina sp.]